MNYLQIHQNEIVFALIMFIFLFKNYFISKIYKIKMFNVKELNNILSNNNEEDLLIDVRTPQEYSRGHIEKSKNIELRNITEHIKSNLKKYDKKNIYLICQSGSRSMNAALNIKKLGIKNVYNIKGGMMRWHLNKLPIK